MALELSYSSICLTQKQWIQPTNKALASFHVRSPLLLWAVRVHVCVVLMYVHVCVSVLGDYAPWFCAFLLFWFWILFVCFSVCIRAGSLDSLGSLISLGWLAQSQGFPLPCPIIRVPRPRTASFKWVLRIKVRACASKAKTLMMELSPQWVGKITQWVKWLPTEIDDQHSIPGTNIVGKNCLPRVVLWCLHIYSGPLFSPHIDKWYTKVLAWFALWVVQSMGI